MKLRILSMMALAVLILVSLFSCSKSDQGPSWLFDYDQALLKSSQEKKLVMVDFYADWCGWCKRLASETYRDPQVKERIKDFICLRINTEKDRITGQKFGIKALPTILILDSSGREIKRQEGFLPGPQFLQVLAQAMNQLVELPKDCEGINYPNLVANGSFTDQYTGWERALDDLNKGASKTEIVPFPNGQSEKALYVKHNGDGFILFSQIVEVPGAELIFSAIVQASSHERVVSGFRGTGLVQIGLQYLDEANGMLGQTTLLNHKKNPYADIPMIGVPRKENDTYKTHYVDFKSGEFNKLQIDLRKEIEDNLQGLDLNALKKIAIVIWCGANHPLAGAEIRITDIALTPTLL